MAVKGMSVFTHQGEDYTINDPNIAPEFDVSVANTEGEYVYYQGDLYRFDAAYDANTAWSSRSKTKVKLGEDIIARIAAEATERQSADEVLDDKIAKEAAARGNDEKIIAALAASEISDTTIITETETQFNVYFEPHTGLVSKAGYTGYIYTVTPGDVINIKVGNYNHDDDDAVVVFVGAERTDDIWYAYADNLNVIVPYGYNKLYINYNRSLSETPAAKKYNLPNSFQKTIYDEIHDKEPVELFDGTLSGFAGGTVDNNTITISGQNQGAITNIFDATSNVVKVEFEGVSTVPVCAFQIAIHKNDNTTEYVVIGSIANGTATKLSMEFDAANFAVYKNAKNYQLIINSVNSTDSGTVTVESLTIYESSTFAQQELYNADFVKMMENVFAKTASIEQQVSGIGSNSSMSIGNANGTKYSLQVMTDGTIAAISHTPSDALFMGNSLLLGMNTPGDEHGAPFGMAATDNTKDYFYLTKQAILEMNPQCVFSKQHTAGFEQSESTTQSDNYINTYKSMWTGKDLVIVQLGDNVNNATRRAVFAQKFPDLISSIRTLSPNARVIIMGAWFGTANREVMRNTANRYGCLYIDLSDLCVSENFATVGETITYPDGTTATMEAAWVSHPGNPGMIKIADRLIEALDM